MPNNPATVEAISKRNYHGIPLSASRVQTHRGLHGHFRDTCTPMSVAALLVRADKPTSLVVQTDKRTGCETWYTHNMGFLSFIR